MAQIIYNSLFKFDFPFTANELLQNAINNDNLDSIIIVVPTDKLERRLKQNTIRQYYDKYKKPLPSINAFSLSSFIEYCYDKIFTDRKRNSISEAYRLALLDEAVVKADLKFYSTNHDRISPVLLERLANVIFGLKEDGMTIEELRKDIQNQNDLIFYDSKRLEDVTKLYQKYEELREEKYLDSTDITNKITDYLHNNSDIDYLYNQILKGQKFVLFNGFSDFKMPEVKFISLFAKSKCPFALHIDYSTNNGPLFGNLAECIENFNANGLLINSPEDLLEKKYLAQTDFNVENTESKDYPRERYLRTRLFNTDTDLENKAFSKIIKILEAENRTNEVIYLAKLSKYLLLKKDFKPEDICICMRQPEIYSHLFREIFSSYKIPANISDRYELSSSPVVTSIFSVLDVVNYGYLINDVHKTLLSSYITIGDDKFEAQNLFAMAQRFRIIGGDYRKGGDYWEKVLRSKTESAKNRLQNLQNNIIENKDDIERAKLDLSCIEKALEDFNTLRKILPDKKSSYSPKEFNDLININIIDNLKIKRNILESYNEYLSKKSGYNEPEKIIFEEAIEKDARALSAFIGLLNELTYITTDREPGRKFKLIELINKLKIAVTGEKYQIREKQNFGVNITSIEQTRGIPYKVSILCGAVDGEFPLNYRPETFLGKELKDTIERHIQSERIQFYQFLTNDKNALDKSEKMIFITYPVRNESEDLVRSSFVDALLKIMSLRDDGKVYNISKIKNALINNNTQKNPPNHLRHAQDDKLRQVQIDFDMLLKQAEDLPWLNLIESENELYYEYGSLGRENIILRQAQDDTARQAQDEDNKKTIDFIGYYLNQLERNSGLIDLNKLDETARKRLGRYKDSPISITDLESYAKCPFQLFVKKILRIPEPKDLELELSPLDLGNILHNILYQFYTGNQSIIHDDNSYEYLFESSVNQRFPKIIPVTLKKENYNSYLQQLKDIAHREFDLLRFEHPFFDLETERILGTDDTPGKLEKWLRYEFDRISNCDIFKPVLFEFVFGADYFGKGKSQVNSIELDGLKIQGKVDRIELVNNDGQFGFMIGDYKNKMSNVAKNSDIKNAISFQMPLYILAVRKILKDYYGIDAKPMGGIYYGFEPEITKDEIISHKFVLVEQGNPRVPEKLKYSSTQVIKKTENLEDILINSLENAKQIVNKISNGIFPVEPLDKSCNFCGYASICRIKEKRDIEEISEDND